jgi:hypothetical protein
MTMSFTNLREENPEESNLENEGAREWALLFLSNDQENSCPERHKRDGRSEVVHHLTGKLFPQGHDAKQLSPPQPEKCPFVLQILHLSIFSSGGS